jgi:iron-sulfur cluster repair protein YtfE (RIC family)
MKKVEFYSHIHKAIRRRLYLAAILIGTTDFEDSVGVETVQKELQSLFRLLRRHAEHENSHVHPLLAKFMPNLQLGEEHALQDRTLESMEALLVSIQQATDKVAAGEVLYREFNDFVTHSLEHMQAEEQLMPRLREEYDNEVLAGAMQRMFATFTPDEIADTATYFPHALNPQERAMFGFA